MADNRFETITDLYNHVMPALKTKQTELKKMNLIVDELVIWEYCLNNIWKYKKENNIYEMVNDILFLDEVKLHKYLKERNSK